jgi:hypothetical protein
MALTTTDTVPVPREIPTPLVGASTCRQQVPTYQLPSDPKGVPNGRLP